MRNTRALAAGLTALAVVVAAACGDSGTDTTATSPNTTTTTTTSVVEGSAEHNQADVMFARMMIPHHAQAIEMSDMILAKPEIPAEVTALAEQIKAAQGPEIAQLDPGSPTGTNRRCPPTSRAPATCRTCRTWTG